MPLRLKYVGCFLLTSGFDILVPQLRPITLKPYPTNCKYSQAIL
jgi:hypothetical protein